LTRKKNAKVFLKDDDGERRKKKRRPVYEVQNKHQQE
jgi:hypothetical protein